MLIAQLISFVVSDAIADDVKSVYVGVANIQGGPSLLSVEPL